MHEFDIEVYNINKQNIYKLTTRVISIGAPLLVKATKKKLNHITKSLYTAGTCKEIFPAIVSILQYNGT